MLNDPVAVTPLGELADMSCSRTFVQPEPFETDGAFTYDIQPLERPGRASRR
jgi:hypothetical protein